jgi:murein DD-endopeptidase MepM/ murein hydrolase activator NlpD
MKYVYLIMLLLVLPCSAKKLYKFQDEQGRWHFTDQKPAPGQLFESRQLKTHTKQHIWLEKGGTKYDPSFHIRNTFYGPVEVEVQFKRRQNALATPDLPRRFVVAHGVSNPLFRVNAINERQSWQFTLEYSFTIGNPLPNYESSVNYLPPLAPTNKFLITQAFAGKFSHQDDQNKYAVDIAMPEGSPVHAARAGIVINVENDYFNSGTEQNYKSRANSIRILHNDGSMAIYAHLALEKAQVYPGLRVSAGQLIGYSGNTGYSSGPHLHFAVQINRGMQLVSVPFHFINALGEEITPKQGQWIAGLSSAIGAL